MAAALRVDDGILRLDTHPAGAEHVGGVEHVVGAVLFDQFLDPGSLEDAAAGSGHETQSLQFHVRQVAVDARPGHAESVPGFAVELDEGTRIRQALADAAGITKAQFHYYITSKEDLYREVLNYIIAEWSDMFFASAHANDPAAIISDYLRMKIRHSVEHPDMTRLFSLEMARGGIDLTDHWGDILGSAGKAIKMIGGWCEAGLMKQVDPVLFLMNMWAVSQYYAEYEIQVRGLLGVAEGEPLDAERISREAIELFLARAGLSQSDSEQHR